MQRILVTGGAGFIGSHTCKALAAAGFLPICYDNLEHGHADAVRWGPLIEGDIGDVDRVKDALVRYQPTALIHFAAYAYVGESMQDPAKYYRNNVENTLRLFHTCRLANVNKVIFSSSCAVYGVPSSLPISESAQLKPISPYGHTKAIGEQILRDFGAAYGTHHIALRYFNAAGADPAGQLTERHTPETHIIPRALMAAAGTIPYLEVFGDDYPTADGTCIRDYVHVSDLADAHTSALKALIEGEPSGAFNLGTGRGTSVREILDSIHAITGKAVPAKFRSRRPGDPPSLYADATLARDLLGFQPRLTTVADLIRTAAPSFGLPKVASSSDQAG